MQRRRAESRLSRSRCFACTDRRAQEQESVTPKERRGTLVFHSGASGCMLTSVGASAFALRRPPRALTSLSLSTSVGTRDKRHNEGQITLANLPFCFSNYPAPRKQNRLQFSCISIELIGWLALIRKPLCHPIPKKERSCVLVYSQCDICYETRLSGDGETR